MFHIVQRINPATAQDLRPVTQFDPDKSPIQFQPCYAEQFIIYAAECGTVGLLFEST